MDTDIIGERARVVNCGWEFIGDTPLIIDQKAEVVSTREEVDCGCPRIGI